MTMVINGIPVTCNEPSTEEQLLPYVKLAQAKYPHAQWNNLEIRFVDNNEVELHYDIKKQNFQRIRRITGYLVGDESSWNNAKLDELRHRRNHDIVYEERD